MTRKPNQPSEARVQFYSSFYEQLRHIWQQGHLKAIFISIDFETYEKQNECLIEVGYSVFSPREEQRTYHYILKEALDDGLRNGTHCPCRRNKFRFGNRKGSPRLGKFMYRRGPTATEVVRTKQIGDRLENTIANYRRQGPVYFVGHRVAGDLKALRSLGIEVEAWSQDIPKVNPDVDEDQCYPVQIVDTWQLYDAAIRCGGSKSLEDMCVALGVVGSNSKHFHNAGERC